MARRRPRHRLRTVTRHEAGASGARGARAQQALHGPAETGKRGCWRIAVTTRIGSGCWWPNKVHWPPKRNRRYPICFSPYLYRARNLVERFLRQDQAMPAGRHPIQQTCCQLSRFVKLASIRLWGCALMSLRPRRNRPRRLSRIAPYLFQEPSARQPAEANGSPPSTAHFLCQCAARCRRACPLRHVQKSNTAWVVMRSTPSLPTLPRSR